jgi:hypothetical protein
MNNRNIHPNDRGNWSIDGLGNYASREDARRAVERNVGQSYGGAARLLFASAVFYTVAAVFIAACLGYLP